MDASSVASSLALQKHWEADSARVSRDKYSGLHLRDGENPVPTTIFQINDLDPDLLFRVILPMRDTFSDQPLAINFEVKCQIYNLTGEGKRTVYAKPATAECKLSVGDDSAMLANP
jgi:hypothetical protein